MDDSPPLKPESGSPEQLEADPQASRKRKVAQKTVVRVKIETNTTGKQRGEGPPSDHWSWRKYGQKPIKGSPYPRGYYRCSTSKGCSAKKQVERCRTDPSVLIITYTSDHNHENHDPPNTDASTTTALHSRPTNEHGLPTADGTEEPSKTAARACREDAPAEDGEEPPPGSPLKCPDEDVPQNKATAEKEETHHPIDTPFEEGGGAALAYADMKKSSVELSKSSEDNFFDELEELPVSSSFTGWVRSSSFDDRALLPLPIPLLDY